MVNDIFVENQNDEYEYDEVADIFVRVNSLGTKLRGSDLALAQITAKWHDSLDIFDEYRKECKAINWDIIAPHNAIFSIDSRSIF